MCLEGVGWAGAWRVGAAEIRKILDCQLCSLYDDDDNVDDDDDEVDALEHVIMPTKPNCCIAETSFERFARIAFGFFFIF